MSRATGLRITILTTSLILAFTAGEMGVRLIGAHDQSGNFVFRNRVIHPLHMPIAWVQSQVKAITSSNASAVIYHPVMGWVPRGNARSENGLYAYNAQGIRSSPREYSLQPAPGRLRIALFGDSFTHGDDVPYADTFGAQLERSLNDTGTAAEVLNFGVGGYGIDQALLRYHEQGVRFSPKLVILGFQAENLKRDLNLIRPIYDPRSALPFAKPRFVLEDGKLAMVNVPVLPLEDVVPTLRDFDHWPLRPYEYFYDRRDYARAWWQGSKLLAVLADRLGHHDDDWLVKRVIFRDNSEAQRLGWAVIKAFATDVVTHGGDFLIVHLPTREDLEIFRRLGRWPYQSFLDALDRTYAVVSPARAMLQVVRTQSYTALYTGHYTKLGNQIVAAAIDTWMREHELPSSDPGPSTSRPPDR